MSIYFCQFLPVSFQCVFIRIHFYQFLSIPIHVYSC
jgi:hypothetical protein